MLMAGEAQQARLARTHFEPGQRGRGEIVHDGVAAGCLHERCRQEKEEHQMTTYCARKMM